MVGVIIGGGKVYIVTAIVEGGGRPFYFTDCTARIGRAVCGNQTLHAVAFGQGVDVTIEELDIRMGPAISTTSAISYSSTFGGSGGRGNACFGRILYGQGPAALTCTYIFRDSTNGSEAAQIDHISGSGSSGQANFGGDIFGVVRGEYRASAAPTGRIAYTRGSRVGNAAPASGDPMGWA